MLHADWRQALTTGTLHMVARVQAVSREEHMSIAYLAIYQVLERGARAQSVPLHYR